MAQIYRIYINEKVLLITEFIPSEKSSFQPVDHQFVDLGILYKLISKQHKHSHFYMLCNNARDTFRQLRKTVQLIEAAGGLVKNERKEFLAIYRNDKWDLPKGKVEIGEKVRKAAVREVEEECGIVVEKSGKKICKTYHMYTMKNTVVLKKTHWYKMKCMAQDKLIPQVEEGITKAVWLTNERVAMVCENTYPSIIQVLHQSNVITERAVLPLE